MATVSIPWFTGAPVGGVSPYFGKAWRQKRQLQAISQGLYGVGALLRKERSQGLPPGATDADLEAEEARLESETQNAQSKVQQDSTHPVERATTAGDHAGAEAIKNDPASYADAKHEESQGLLPQLGHFMKTGVERLMFGDPKRRERLAHIQRMKGQLAAEKDRENFFKTAGSICMKSEDPEACLRAAGGGRYGITTLPKAVQKPTLADELQKQGIVPPPSKGMGGSTQDRRDQDIATEHVRQRHGGVLPEDPNVARREVDEEVEQLHKNRQTAKEDDLDRRRRALVDYKSAQQAARQAERDAKRAAATGGTTITESWSEWKDRSGVVYQFSDEVGERLQRQFPNLALTKSHVTTHRKVADQPDQPAGKPEQPAAKPKSRVPETDDPGETEFGVPFYAPVMPR